MNVRLWDYACAACGTEQRDYPVFAARIPTSIGCNCGARATWVTQKTNHIHPTLSTLRYGEFDPQFGCVVRDYTHKQQLLREMNLIEVGEFDEDEVRNNPLPSEAREQVDAGEVMAADTVEEITAAISADRIDRGATGRDAREKPLLDSWGSI
jgi:hypothetical protein